MFFSHWPHWTLPHLELSSYASIHSFLTVVSLPETLLSQELSISYTTPGFRCPPNRKRPNIIGTAVPTPIHIPERLVESNH